jgi:hypothetical protein
MTNLSFSAASMWSKSTYVLAHPDSEMGDPNWCDQRGYELVAIQPDGLMIYRRKLQRKPWWRRLCQRHVKVKP